MQQISESCLNRSLFHLIPSLFFCTSSGELTGSGGLLDDCSSMSDDEFSLGVSSILNLANI